MKKLIPLLCILIIITAPLFSQEAESDPVDPGYEQEVVETDQRASFQWVELPFSPSVGTNSGSLLEGEATSEGFFRLSYMPEVRLGPFNAQFDFKFTGQLSIDPFDIHLDFADWQLPDRGDEPLEQWAKAIAYHYSRFIRFMQWGRRYEPVYARYGKLMGITLGDGALINGFFDQGVDVRSSRPGFELMLNLGGTSLHFITNDLFAPTLTAWRFSAKPLAAVVQAAELRKVELGLSWAYSPPSFDTSFLHRPQFFALDGSYPIYEWEFLNLSLFGNLIAEATDGAFFAPALGWRWGLWGHTKNILVFNASITNTIDGAFHGEYYSSTFENRSASETDALLLPIGTQRLDATLNMNISRYGVYLRTKMSGHLTDSSYHDYQFVTSIHIDKRLFNIVSLDFTYEKLYPTSTGERFFEGLKTLRNVALNASMVVKAKPYTLDLGLNASFDDQGEATYKLSTAVRVTIL